MIIFLKRLTFFQPGTPFKGAFYMLFVASSVVDLVMVGCTIHEFRLVSFPLTNEIFENYDCQVCVRTRVTLAFICPFTQDLLNCFIALNRLTAIMQPTQADDLWKKLLPFSICFSYLLSIAIFTPAGARLFYNFPPYDSRYIPWVIVVSDYTLIIYV
ncbi:hypothetical protein PENTCL1PPCAC_18788 [Pristionchus entomophagus]|uniref:Serpentine receptor class gamma n=1 Tax=Pristionchus entomophagus TaxID=358040 RepID=A0AAV5TQ86_9BILA|nr:hypothetical protein PENTCL1PPCAC_18788 [Pristionchus entomophagus]